MMCSELVIHDHMVLRRALDILDGMVQKMETGGRIEIADASVLLEFFRRFGAEYHQSAVESVLFPALQSAAEQAGGQSLRTITLEHAEERLMFSRMQDALWARRGADFVRSARLFSKIQRAHYRKEDAVVLGLVEKHLSDEDDEAKSREFTQKRIAPEACLKFASFERKYVARRGAGAVAC
jgi:hemerythrin-like domain-containing protein